MFFLLSDFFGSYFWTEQFGHPGEPLTLTRTPLSHMYPPYCRDLPAHVSTPIYTTLSRRSQFHTKYIGMIIAPSLCGHRRIGCVRRSTRLQTTIRRCGHTFVLQSTVGQGGGHVEYIVCVRALSDDQRQGLRRLRSDQSVAVGYQARSVLPIHNG